MNIFITLLCVQAGPADGFDAADFEQIRQTMPDAVWVLPAATSPTQSPARPVAVLAGAVKPHTQGAGQRNRQTDWTEGLKIRTANALRAYGLTSRQEVAELPRRRLKRIPNIGHASLEDIRLWLGR